MYLSIFVLQAVEKSCWPDAAVESITALEKASHENLGSDFQKYNQKMRQLDFNLKVEKFVFISPTGIVYIY